MYEIAYELVKRAKASGFDVHGPAEIEYGFGWSQTASLWHGERRIHLYYDPIENREAMEVAELDSKVLIGTYKTVDQAWQVVDLFLCQNVPFEELPNCSWAISTLDHDKFIPHPPDASNPANIGQIIRAPEWSRWHPPRDTWLQKMINSIFKRFR